MDLGGRKPCTGFGPIDDRAAMKGILGIGMAGQANLAVISAYTGTRRCRSHRAS